MPTVAVAVNITISGMKRIGILSDTHSTWDDRYAVHFKDCDEIWHAGDIGDIDLLLRLQAIGPMVRAVRGNIDHGDVARVCPELLQFEVEGVHAVLTHIGGYPGHYTSRMYALLRRTRPQLMVDGHSHILRVMYDKSLGVLHINPGAAGTQGWQQVRTLVRLSIDGIDIRDLQVIELGKKII